MQAYFGPFVEFNYSTFSLAFMDIIRGLLLLLVRALLFNMHVGFLFLVVRALLGFSPIGWGKTNEKNTYVVDILECAF